MLAATLSFNLCDTIKRHLPSRRKEKRCELWPSTTAATTITTTATTTTTTSMPHRKNVFQKFSPLESFNLFGTTVLLFFVVEANNPILQFVTMLYTDVFVPIQQFTILLAFAIFVVMTM